MYNQHFGLSKSPFTMTPDPAFLFLTPQHREALAGLTYSIVGRRGFVALIGDAGSGKTTLLTQVLDRLPATRVNSSVILTPTLTPVEFFELMLLDFGLSEIPASKAQRLLMLQRFLVEAQSSGKVSVLVVDEAHKLTPDVLEEIRLLGNFERPDQKLLQIVLAGQNELDEILDRGDLRQLKQRISMRLCLGPLEPAEVEQYIGFRWRKAGGTQTAPFSAAAILALVRYSRGVPRLVNSLCDNALILAFGEGSMSVTAHHVADAAKDLAIRNGNGYSPGNWNGVAPSVATPPLVAAALPAVDRVMVSTLERYGQAEAKTSRWAKWTGKLGRVGKAGVA